MIPKGPNKELERKILALLYKTDKEAQIPWQKFIDIAQECNEIFCREGWKCVFRKIPIKVLQKKELKKFDQKELEEEFEKLRNFICRNSIDHFYDPAAFWVKEDKDWYYPNDYDAHQYLQKILLPDFKLPQDIFGRKSLVHYYVLGLKKAFYLLSKENNPPLPIAIKLINLLYEIHGKLCLFKEEVEEGELIRDRKRDNRLSTRPKIIKEIEKHTRYSELELIMKEYQETNKEKGEMHRVISEIVRDISPTKKKNPHHTTLKTYRDTLIKNYREKKAKNGRN